MIYRKLLSTLFKKEIAAQASLVGTTLVKERDTLHRDIGHLQRQLESLRASNREEIEKRAKVERQNEILRITRNVAYTRPPGRLAEKDLRATFKIDNETPLWRALHQELDDQLQDLIDQASLEPSAAMTEAKRLHLAGGIEYLRRFQKTLLDHQALAHHHDPEI
jgi:hypothetical protein